MYKGKRFVPGKRSLDRVLGGLIFLGRFWGMSNSECRMSNVEGISRSFCIRHSTFDIRNSKSSFLPLAVFLLALAFSTTASAQLQRPAAAHYDVVALRVEFQPDTTRFTTGDGTFDGQLFPEELQPLIDPLPHDAAYFEAHLAFLEDYVAKISDGQTQVTTHLVPEVVRVSQEMGAYSPTGFESDSDEERVKLVSFIREAWTTASQVSDFDLSGFDRDRTAFVLFHAGVGRDIELLGTVLDKTPFDLPSISFSERELRRLDGRSISFNGFPVRQTLLMPRTESRPGFNFVDDVPILLELSINGLLAASFFNYLGVPDLFNTETGESAIGPFGLMDPLGIFAYSGLFAPEPNAWTKYYLGWLTPLDLTGDGPQTVALQAAGLSGGTQAARASISSAEYFLVENRNRDPEGDGLVLRVWQNGQIVEQNVPMITDDFSRFGVEGFTGGVVVGVDNYDFALPGIDADDIQYEGGVLIWHIDERVLAENLETGGVNADPERRAVDLEEADSAQDLGTDNSLGAPFDFFWLDNPVRVITATNQEIRLYKNRLGPDTVPNSNTNEGGASFIVLEDFSAPGTEMTFVYRREAEGGIAPMTPPSGVDVPGVYSNDGSVFFVPEAGNTTEMLALDSGPKTAIRRLAGITVETGAVDRLYHDGLSRPFLTSAGQAFFYGRFAPPDILRIPIINESPSPVSQSLELPPELEGKVPASPVVLVREGNQDIEYSIWSDGFDPLLARLPEFPFSARMEVIATDVAHASSIAVTPSNQVIIAGQDQARFVDGSVVWPYTFPEAVRIGQATFGADKSGFVGVVPALQNRELFFLRADETIERIDVGERVPVESDSLGILSDWPVLVDLDDDGLLDVLTTYGENLVAFSQNGALISGFPIALTAPSVTQPLVAELTDSGGWSVLVATTSGEIYAYDTGRDGALVSGFPLAVGARVRATPLLQNKKLFAVSTLGTVHAWQLDNLGAIWWGQLFGDAQNQNFAVLADEPDPQPTPQAAGLIVEAETYNWPNPIREGQTFLRCMTTQDASVRITIIDTAGSLIDEVALDLRGGTPAEHLWQTGAESGLYYARITATGANGQTATKLIKMAIIR